MKTNKIAYLPYVIIALSILVLIVSVILSQVQQAQGSVIQGNEYNATSTAPSASQGAQVLTTTRLLKTGGGSLAQVCILGANTGGLDFYNATTSDVTKRTGQIATSSILLSSFPPSIVAGCYTFDSTFSTGLLMSLSGSGVPTTTVMWR